jgi:hypothetical protein
VDDAVAPRAGPTCQFLQQLPEMSRPPEDTILSPPSAAARRSASALLLMAALSLWAAPGRAFVSLFDRVSDDADLVGLFDAVEARAEVEDGFLIGTGSERVRHLPDGKLEVTRTRHYTRVRHPDKKRIAVLPQPWEATSTLLLEPSLRLLRSDTRLHFDPAADGVFPGTKLSDAHDWLFKLDRTLTRAVEAGRRLEQQTYLNGKVIASERYDYPAKATPLEIVGLYLSIAVARRIEQFDFDLLVPGGSVHGVRAEIHRTRDVRRYAQGYRVPAPRLVSQVPLAVVDMRLASPVKYLFFPHHFFMAYDERTPSQLVMMWGGDPDENLQAFRTP